MNTSCAPITPSPFLAKENIMAQWCYRLGSHKELEIFKEYALIKKRHKIAPPLVLKILKK